MFGDSPNLCCCPRARACVLRAFRKARKATSHRTLGRRKAKLLPFQTRGRYLLLYFFVKYLSNQELKQQVETMSEEEESYQSEIIIAREEEDELWSSEEEEEDDQ